MDEREAKEAGAQQPDDSGAAGTTTDTETDIKTTSTTGSGNAGTTPQPTQAASPQQVLDELNKSQREAEANAKRFSDQSQALKTDIAALQKAQGETGDTATAYGKARPSLEQQREDLEAYIEKKKENIERAVGPKKGQVDAAATVVEDEAKKLESGRETQRTELVKLAKDRLGEERYLAAAREDLDAEKARQNTIKGRLTRLTELQQELDAAEEAGEGVRMYAVYTEFVRQLGLAGDELEPVDGYRKDLEASWAKLYAAQGALRDATQLEAEKQRELQGTKDELARLDAKRIDEILKRVPEDTGTGTGGSGGSGSGGGGSGGSTSTPSRATA
jgi:DNA repair exonuclease SbcCD ATPase subunit